jgi:hypothetical protein
MVLAEHADVPRERARIGSPSASASETAFEAAFVAGGRDEEVDAARRSSVSACGRMPSDVARFVALAVECRAHRPSSSLASMMRTREPSESSARPRGEERVLHPHARRPRPGTRPLLWEASPRGGRPTGGRPRLAPRFGGAGRGRRGWSTTMRDASRKERFDASEIFPSERGPSSPRRRAVPRVAPSGSAIDAWLFSVDRDERVGSSPTRRP